MYDAHFLRVQSDPKTRALIKGTNKIVGVREAKRLEEKYVDPLTKLPVIPKVCSQKVDHFAFTAHSLENLNGETALHYACKTKLCDVLQKVYPNGNWKTERPIKKSKEIPKLVPDISGRIDGKPIAIEVQNSRISFEKIMERTLNYTNRKIYLLWVTPMKEHPENGIVFRPSKQLQFLHHLYYHRAYFWVKGSEIISVHFSLATRYITETEYYTEDAEYVQHGGYEKTYKVNRTADIGKSLDITKDFKCKIKEPDEDKFNPIAKMPQTFLFKDNRTKWW